jgi:diguanylate cyclase (GGDEF)-like protein
MGTTQGLVRFDGARMTRFTPSDAAGLPSGYVLDLEAPPEGGLWIGTANGLCRYRDGTFEAFTTKDGLPQDVVLCLASDGAGGVWTGTNGGGLAHLSEGRFTVYTARDGLIEDTIRSLHLGPDGVLWVGSSTGIARIAEGRASVFSRTAFMPAQPVGPGHTPLLLDGRGFFEPIGETRRDLAPPRLALGALKDRDGSLWCVRGEDIPAFRIVPPEFRRLAEPEEIRDFTAHSLLEDREGGLWLGEVGRVRRLKNPEVLSWGRPEGLAIDVVYSVSRGLEDRLWVAGEDSLALFEDGAVRSFPGVGRPFGVDLLCALESPALGVLVGTSRGLFRFQNGVLRRGPRSGATRAMIISLCGDSAGRVWAGTRGDGLYRIEGDHLRRYTNRDGLTDNLIGALLAAPDGSLWAGGTAGLNRLDPHTGRVTTFSTREGLAANYILSLLLDSRGALWAASWGGLTRVKDGRLSPLTLRHGLPSDVLYQILEDDGGRLWMSSPQGLFGATLDDLHAAAEGTRSSIPFRRYGTADGMRTVKCWGTVQPAGCRDGAGRIWFATQEGLVCADPCQEPASVPLPNLVVESVFVDGRAFPPGGPVIAPPGPRRLEVSFTAPTFTDPSRLAFRYRLEDLESDWTEAGTRRTAYYTNLPAGTYLLRVTARVGGGAWSEPGAGLPITLRPFVYETAWFRGLALLLAAFGLWGGFRWRVRRLRARKRQLEVLVDERTAQLADANRELERLANEDGLTRIPNVRHFRARLEAEWRRAFRSLQPLSVLLLDVDHFKRFNDRYGHIEGDACLKRVASVLHERMRRPGDLAARYGGEEFVVLLPETGAPGAALLAEELRAAVEALGLPHEGSDAASVVTVSIGRATASPRDGLASEGLLAAADRALYRAKSLGRNRVEEAENAEADALAGS